MAAVFPVVFLYSENIDEVGLATFGAVLGLVLLFSIFFSAIVWIIFRDNIKAGFLATAWILLFFTAGHVFDELLGRSILGFEINRYLYLAAISAVFGAATLYLSVWRAKTCLTLTPYISGILVFLVLFNVGSIIVHTIVSPVPNETKPTKSVDLDMSEVTTGSLPDIYYIILDSYPREDVLQEIFDFDNSDFLDSLEDSGFFIASKSRANYVHTFLSLPSSMNMAHLDYLTDIVGSNSRDTRIPKSLIRNSEVSSFAKSLGYKLIHLSSSPALIEWLAGRSEVETDLDRPSLGRYPLGSVGRIILEPVVGNDFGFTLFNKTLIGHASVTHRRSSLLGSLGEYVDQWIRANRASTYVENVGRLTTISNNDEPTFALAHFLPPHPPYLFDSNGAVPSGRVDFKDWGNKDLYIDQLRWVNWTTRNAVQQIQENDGRSSIIIIQGDHGPLSTDSGHVFSQGGKVPRQLVYERSAILNAYFLPRSCEPADFYADITPVNSFRLVFNACFGTDLELLEDRSYWSMTQRPYDFNLVDELLEKP